MTTPTEATRSALASYAGLQALVGNGDSPETYRIYNMIMPQSSSYPVVVIHKIAQTRENTMAASGGQGVENARMRLTCYSTTLAQAESVAEQCRLALKNAEGSNFRAVQVFNTDNFEDGTQLYQVIVDYSIWYRH